MKKKITLALVAIAAVAISISGYTLSTADQPFMEKAKDNLQSARTYLNRATADKGGHRNKAINQVNQAIVAINNGIEYDRTHRSSQEISDAAIDDFASGQVLSVSADQPNMQEAKDELQKAIENLNKASADKGGWRNKAINFTRNAINHVNAGMAYDKRN